MCEGSPLPYSGSGVTRIEMIGSPGAAGFVRSARKRVDGGQTMRLFGANAVVVPIVFAAPKEVLVDCSGVELAIVVAPAKC